MASDIEIGWMGYCTRDGSDKIWGVCGDRGGASYTFWGRRGKTIKATRYHGLGIDERDLIESKVDKGYCKVPMHQRDELHPGLLDHIERAIVLSKLKG